MLVIKALSLATVYCAYAKLFSHKFTTNKKLLPQSFMHAKRA